MAIKYLLDTNIISELERIRPNPTVATKIQTHQKEIAISAISWHELLYGFHRLPSSKRKSRVQYFLEQTVYPNIPIILFEEVAAEYFARERARLSKMGLSPSFADGQIATTAIVNDLTLVTRNTDDFSQFENIEIENWFDSLSDDVS
ncbi:MAG: type II toxin-antitoxin system VapC family toxin [Chloroflexota bacterium]